MLKATARQVAAQQILVSPERLCGGTVNRVSHDVSMADIQAAKARGQATWLEADIARAACRFRHSSAHDAGS